MNQQPDQEELYDAMNEYAQSIPEADSLGLFCYSDGPPAMCGSGMGAFYWFESNAKMLTFLKECLCWYHPGPSSMSPEHIAAEIQSIVSHNETPGADWEALRGSLNDFMAGLWQIPWIGTFGELCIGDSEYARQVRQDYLDADDGNSPSIGEEEIVEFIEYLQEYGI